MILTRALRLLSAAAISFVALDNVCAAAAGELPNPHPREVLVGEELLRWDFQDGVEGWAAVHDCRLAADDGVLTIQSLGVDPYLSAAAVAEGSEFVVRLRMRSRADGLGQLFWSSTKHAGTSAERHVSFRLIHDGQWHEYQVRMRIDGDLTRIRLDPGSAPGEVQVDWISISRGGLHPLEIVGVRQPSGKVDVQVRNHSDGAIDLALDGLSQTVAAQSDVTLSRPVPGNGPLRSKVIRVASPGLPTIERTVWVYEPRHAVDVISRTADGLTIDAARDGSLVQLKRGEQPVAALAPLVHVDHQLPGLRLAEESWPLKYVGDGISVELDVTDEGDLRVAIHSDKPVEGPIVRAFGSLEQGLLAGVEYLGRGEHSSSKLDIETAEHLRVEPDPMKLTMPLMAAVTDRASVAVAWDDTTLRPVLAMPDFLDGTASHRMALKGSAIEAVVRIREGWNDGGRLEPLILWGVQRRGLPPVPSPPRSFEQQMQLSLAAYSGLVHDPENGGWFHAVVPGVRRSPNRGAYFADCASAIWRITGRVPDVPHLQLGGAHVRNPASYFVTGRAADWLQTVNRQARQLIAAQQSDGSYRYDGRYRRGHFENTASGICARPAYLLLEHAYCTGDRQSLAAGLKTLEYLKRFRTPRGAQTWEVPLHTPDILASAHAVWAYVRAYELTGDEGQLAEARRWATTGMPFVYQWSNQPIMVYATTPVYGATNWRAPNWIGLPVQWCGTVYAYALLMLADYDQTLDWRKVAEGILVCGEQMQYPDGRSVGCLPDVFELKSQKRRPADINPGALVSLRLRVNGRLDALALAAAGEHRVIAPFPVTVENGRARIHARRGTHYQVVIDGTRIVDIESEGEDVIPLDAHDE
jgi:hypothetical protein